MHGHPYILYSTILAAPGVLCVAKQKFQEGNFDSNVCEALISSCALQDLDWFWEMVGDMGDEQRRELLCFWTSMSTVPAGMLHPTAISQHVHVNLCPTCVYMYTPQYPDKINCTHTVMLGHIAAHCLLVASRNLWQFGTHTSLLMKDLCCHVTRTIASNFLALLTLNKP